MMRLHIANTYFEEELSQGNFPPPQTALAHSKIYRKLQWLPFLYAGAEEGVLVTEPPPAHFFDHLPAFTPPRCHLFSDPDFTPYQELISWGASPSVAAFAKKQKLQYSMPAWEIVRKVNGKNFSYLQSPQLPGSALLYTQEDALKWCNEQLGPAVLKTCFGLSGRGHLLLPEQNAQLPKFLQKALQKGDPLIGEPWVKRMFDFSTQWEILQPGEIQFLGATLCINDARGRYKETRIGTFAFPLHLEAHKKIVLPLLQEIQALGYFGNVGIDAMVYEDAEGKEHLHPVVEINARKTMGWVSLMLQRRHFPNRNISISFSLGGIGLMVIVKPWSC